MNCTHFWQIEHGGLGKMKSLGICKHCNAKKDFQNWIDFDGRTEEEITGGKEGKERAIALRRSTFSLAGSNPVQHNEKS